VIHIRSIYSRHKLSMSIAAVAVVVALGGGGYVVANSDSSNAVSGSSVVSSNANTAKVIPFQPGSPSPATPVGQIPAGFKDGDGTLITGTAADKAKAAAAAAYPGGNINRVSLLSDGEYNVHIIGVNWPHHVFVSKDFKVVGAL
jgi:hypothetical protein